MPKWGVAAAAAVIGLVVVYFAGRERRPELDPPAVVAQVRQLNQLATVRYTVQKVIGIREQMQPVGEESILIAVQARVEAGIDLAHMRQEDVSVGNDGTVTVRLPPARVLNVAVDEKDTKVWDRQKTWWTVWVPYSPDLEQRARQAGLAAAKDAALEMGILRHAERNAEDSIRSLLTLAGVKAVRVVPAS